MTCGLVPLWIVQKQENVTVCDMAHVAVPWDSAGEGGRASSSAHRTSLPSPHRVRKSRSVLLILLDLKC